MIMGWVKIGKNIPIVSSEIWMKVWVCEKPNIEIYHTSYPFTYDISEMND